ncbi:MAG: signal peptidase I [Bacilli bacterium]|jgi:signal peptidase I|nr:signal peptidase I [Bacilli bacterium]
MKNNIDEILDNKSDNKKKSFIKEIIELACLVIVMFLIFNYVLMSVRVSGTSMLPTYQDGNRGIMVRYMGFNKPNYDDVVVIDYDWQGENEYIVKRIIGLPGDTVEVKNNQVYVNNKAIADPHRMPGSEMADEPSIKLASDEYYVLGDNRDVSKDSRIIGPVNISKIKAVDGFIYWPLSNIKIMN